MKQHYHRSRQYESGQGLDILLQLCRNKEYHCSVPLLFFKYDFMVSNKLSFKEGIVYEDMLFTFQTYALAIKVAYIDRTFYQRRYRDNSIMTSKTTPFKFRSMKMVYEQLILFTEKCKIFNMPVSKQYIARCAFNVINIFSGLSAKDQNDCMKEYCDIKRNILEHRAFNNTALRMRCHGYLPWFAYKLYEKSFGRLVNG